MKPFDPYWYENALHERYSIFEVKHGSRYCFCTDCLEAADCGCGPDEPDYDEWKRAFPNLDWEK